MCVCVENILKFGHKGPQERIVEMREDALALGLGLVTGSKSLVLIQSCSTKNIDRFQ